MGKKAVAYLRVSMDEQGKSGLGLEAQEACIRDFAVQEKFEIVEFLTEVSSGKLGIEDRPVLKEALAQAKKLHGYVIVAKLDRLSREVSLISGMMSAKVPFIACNLGVDADPLLLHIYAAVSEQERKMIGQRTKAALAAKKVREPWWKPGKAKTPEKAANQAAGRARGNETAHTLAAAFAEKTYPVLRKYRDSGMSLVDIAEQMNILGVKTARGGLWYPTTIKNVLELHVREQHRVRELSILTGV